MASSSNHSRAGKNNLIGNPYPSAIDGYAFFSSKYRCSWRNKKDFLKDIVFFG
jgi:hypothetical protein